MDWSPCRTGAVIFLVMVFLEISLGFRVEVKEWDEHGVERWKTFRRQKREWIKFAAAIREGEDNSRRNPIAKIRSDCEETQPIIYRISGKGIDSHPFGVFVINQKTGEINITKIVDREENPFFTIDCHAINTVTQQSVETVLSLLVRVLDVNDNPPIFTQSIFDGSISESSMENTLVMKITATDADEPNTLNSQIAYKIESQTPGGPSKFILNTITGELHIANVLDREEHGSYSLVVKGTDRNGGPDGISSECICNVNVEDVNDNFPTFSQSSYSIQITENTLSNEVLRIQITDLDQIHTDNWKGDCYFISGNEYNNFAISVDPVTNEAILMVIKELDYEQSSNIQLRIGVRNVAPFHYSVANQYQATGTPFTIEVLNINEGPMYQPSMITVSASEGLTIETISTYTVATFQAIDQDTGRLATNVRYQMGQDPAAWFNVDPRTAVITFKKPIDRESIYVTKGQYSAEVLAICTESPFTTATGTIVLTIEDVNDNCPTVSSEPRDVCMSSPSVTITATDLDDNPNGPPFQFTIAAQPETSSWTIRTVSDTSAVLSTVRMNFEIHDVYVNVMDNRGRSCERPQLVPLQACNCDQNRRCTSRATKRVTVIISSGAAGGGVGGAAGGGAGGAAGGGAGGAGGGAAGGGAGGAAGGGAGGAAGGGAGGAGGGTGGFGWGAGGTGGGAGGTGGGTGGFGWGAGGTGGGAGGSGGVGGDTGDYGTGGMGTIGSGVDHGTGMAGGDYGVGTGVGTGVAGGGDSDYLGGRYGERQQGGTMTLSAVAIGLMFLGALIFVLVPILMSQSGCCGYCGGGPVGGVGAGFEPVPECTEGAIHSWGIEGAQPEDRDVSNMCVPVKGATKGEFADSSDIYTTKYGDGGVVCSEETTALGGAKGYGTTVDYGTTAYGTTAYGTTGRKETYGGTIKEYRESGVNMAFLDSYFSEKAFAYADEDEGRPANDCLLIYDHEGIGSPVGSIGCCSFIGDDLDDTYLDTLGPKFKTLAEICLGVEIEPFPDASSPWPSVPNPEIDINLPPPGTTIVVNTSSSMPPPVSPPMSSPMPTAVGGTTVVTENTYTATSTVQPPPRPMPDPVLHGNVVVTETYTSGPTPKPPTISVDPLCGSNVVVTERVVGPASVADFRGMIDIPDLPDGSNVVVTERVIAPNSRIPNLSIPDLADGSNVVVTERVIRPSNTMSGNLSLPRELSGARNVVVTERVVSGSGVGGMSGAMNVGGGMSMGGGELSGARNVVVTERVVSGSGVGGMSGAMNVGGGMSMGGGVGGITGQMLGPDNLFSQTIGSASPGTSRRRVTKYSTIQYSNQ